MEKSFRIGGTGQPESAVAALTAASKTKASRGCHMSDVGLIFLLKIDIVGGESQNPEPRGCAPNWLILKVKSPRRVFSSLVRSSDLAADMSAQGEGARIFLLWH